MNTTTVNTVRRLRRDNPYLPLSAALEIARFDIDERYPDLAWTTDNRTGMRRAAGTVDGFDVEVTISLDQEPQMWGRFTDEWAPGAIVNPQYRAPYTVVEWYVPATGTVEEHRSALSKTGMPRHAAWLRARRNVLTDLRMDADPEQYVIEVTVSRNGHEIAADTISGVSVDPDGSHEDNQRSLMSSAAEIISETLRKARAVPPPAEFILVEITDDGRIILLPQCGTWSIDRTYSGLTAAQAAEQARARVAEAVPGRYLITVKGSDAQPTRN